MKKVLTNDFSWSKSRHEKLAECKRAYYFHYYRSWGGWDAAAPKEAQGSLRQLRHIIKSLAPEAEETISYQIPTFKLNGRYLVHFAAFKNHVSLYPASPTFLNAFVNELKPYQTGKGTVQFPIGKPVPVALVEKLVKARIEENLRGNEPG